MASSDRSLSVETVGENPTRLWGLTMAQRAARLARAEGLAAESTPEGARLLVNAAFAFDPAWFRHAAEHPGFVLTLGGVPALAHARDAAEADRLRAAIADGTAIDGLAYESGPTIENKRLRKRETPFLLPLQPDTVRQIERASYFGAYKGVTDLLTKYLWPEWALVLTRICARLGVTPNMVTLIGALLCVAATVCFAEGRYWLGMALGLGFMVLDTVDGKLARCTVTSSWWGNVFDHGMDIVHPPFWWWFWATGLVHWGLAYDDATFWQVQGVIQIGYWVQRLTEGAFIARFGGLEMHVWQRFDSRLRLVTARRNPNMVILFASCLFGRPDLGLIAVAWWTGLCCLIHIVRLFQALFIKSRGKTVSSWLAES